MFAPSAVFRSKMLRFFLKIVHEKVKFSSRNCLKDWQKDFDINHLLNLALEQQCASEIFSIVGVFSICAGAQLRMLKCFLLKCSSAQMKSTAPAPTPAI